VAFVVFDGDGFILQVHGVLTRIRSWDAAMALYGARTWIYDLLNGSGVHQWRFLARSTRNGCSCVG
jgi:hypothetical protein